MRLYVPSQNEGNDNIEEEREYNSGEEAEAKREPTYVETLNQEIISKA